MVKKSPLEPNQTTTIMTIEKTIQGAWRITDIIGGQLVSRVYFGYGKREAMRQFKLASGKAGA
jgi:hypothetical protein